MGNSQPQPKQPEKTLKQVVQENIKEIGKMRRQFQRQLYKLQSDDKKMNRQLKKLVQKKQPLQNKKNLAQNILKNQRFIAKYKSMDNQLQNTIFQLQQMGTMEQMQKVMNGMANIMGNAKNKFKMNDFTKTMKTYATQKERMQAINQMVQDGMEFDDQIDDTDVDNIIRNCQISANNEKLKKAQMDLDDGEGEAPEI